MSDPSQQPEQRWRPRPLLAFTLRLASVLVPTAAGAAGAYGFVAAIPNPGGVGVVPWAVGLVLTSTIATALAERLGRRFLPLAVLLRLSLVFPDRAPARFAMARGAGNVRRLEQRIREARERGMDAEPARAAEQILGFVAALSAHDRRTRGHSERVRAFTDLVASELRLPEDARDRLRWAALLHDVGKLHVPARILNKPGRPEPHEWETLQGHPAAGARIAAPLLPWLGEWGRAIEQHHERFDGGGYPNGLAGTDIALAARVVSVADSFEVMTAARAYKKPMSVPAARRELAACSGSQFDPTIVRAFLNVSLGRLWWSVGPTSWTAMLPVLGPIQRAASQLAGAANAGAAALAVGAGSMLPVLTGAAAYGSEPSPVVASSTLAPDRDAPPPTDEPTGDAGDGDVGPTEPGSSDPAGDGPVTDPGTDPAPGDDPVGTVVDGTTDVVDGTAGAVDDVVDGVGGVVDDVVDGTTDVADGILPGVGDGVDGTVDGLTDAVDGTVDGLTDAAGGTVDDLTDTLGGLLAR